MFQNEQDGRSLMQGNPFAIPDLSPGVMSALQALTALSGVQPKRTAPMVPSQSPAVPRGALSLQDSPTANTTSFTPMTETRPAMNDYSAQEEEIGRLIRDIQKAQAGAFATPAPRNRSATLPEALLMALGSLASPQLGAGLSQGLNQGYQQENARRQAQYEADTKRGLAQADSMAQLAQYLTQKMGRQVDRDQFSAKQAADEQKFLRDQEFAAKQNELEREGRKDVARIGIEREQERQKGMNERLDKTLSNRTAVSKQRSLDQRLDKLMTLAANANSPDARGFYAGALRKEYPDTFGRMSDDEVQAFSNLTPAEKLSEARTKTEDLLRDLKKAKLEAEANEKRVRAQYMPQILESELQMGQARRQKMSADIAQGQERNDISRAKMGVNDPAEKDRAEKLRLYAEIKVFSQKKKDLESGKVYADDPMKEAAAMQRIIDKNQAKIAAIDAVGKERAKKALEPVNPLSGVIGPNGSTLRIEAPVDIVERYTSQQQGKPRTAPRNAPARKPESSQMKADRAEGLKFIRENRSNPNMAGRIRKRFKETYGVDIGG